MTVTLADFSNEDLKKIMVDIENKYPFISQLITTLQLSNKDVVTNGGLTSEKDGPDEINNIEKGDNIMTTDLKALKEKISSLKAQGDGVVAVSETAEKPEQSKDLDYGEFITTLVDAIGDLKKDAGSNWKVWAAERKALEANIEALKAKIETIRAMDTPKALGEQSDEEESAPPGTDPNSKMVEKRAASKKKSSVVEKKEEEEEEMKMEASKKKAKIEDPGEPTSTLKYEDDEEEEPAKIDKEEDDEEEEKEAPKAGKKKAGGKGVTNTDTTPNFQGEYAYMGDILKAAKKSWGSLR